MAIVAVGDFDAREMEQEIIRRFSGYENPERPRERTEPAVPDHSQTIFTTQTDPESTWTAAIIFNKFAKKQSTGKSDYRNELIEDALPDHVQQQTGGY